MDIFLIIASSIIGILLIGINFYLLALYCHPDDKGFGASLFCKVVVVLGLTLSWAQVLLMPMDVANNKGIQTGGMDMKLCWYIVYMTVLVMVVVLLPFAQFFYETDDEKTMGQRIRDALLLEFCTIVVVGLLLFIGFTYLSTAEIPVKTASLQFSTASSGSSGTTSGTEGQVDSTTILKIPVSFPIFAMGMMAFVGWFFFLVFGGVGLSALPLDMINSFLGRPKLISSKDAAYKKSALKKQTKELIEQGNKIRDEENELKHVSGFMNKRKQKGKVEGEYRKFKNLTLQLEKDHEIFVLELDYMNTNPVVYWIELFLGCIFIIISLLWWLQMYNIQQ